MSVLNPNSEDESPECPLCMEFFELDDINFFPCSCMYQICRFCWNKIRMEGSGLCPACRSPYQENPADFKPLTAEELAKIKAEKRQKDQAKKQKISENRKHLANVRVVQKNLVFVVGLSTRLADSEVLRKQEYFGKFGKIHKVVINHSTSYAGNQNQGPSSSAYVTYFKSEDALRAIQAVNNIYIDGRTLKASLGTTKYCSHFMKNQTCPKQDCMYLHELGDKAASFTKEEMQQGKHTDYERTLHEEMGLQSNDDNDRGENLKKEKSSRSPSPKDSWPNLAGHNNMQNSFPDSDSSRIIKELQEDSSSSSRSIDRLTPEQLNSSEPSPPVINDVKQWNNSRPSTSDGSPPTDFLEEDLGFDPFHETQKALAEMLELESESKMVPLHKPQSLDENHSRQQLHSQENLHLQASSQSPFLQGSPSSSLQSLTAANNARLKAPPPGFNLSNNLPPNLLQQRFSSLGNGSFDNMQGHLQQPQQPQQPQAHMHQAFSNPDFRLSNHLDKPGVSQALHSSFSAGGNISPSGGSGPSWQGKEWQEGFRALLPNVNVSFGNLPNNYPQQQPDNNRVGKVNLHQLIRDEPDNMSRLPPPGNGWKNMLGNNDWTAFDPAIVGGQLSNNRTDSPSNWIKTSVEQQLTSEGNVQQPQYNPKTLPNNLLSGFSNLSMSGTGHNRGINHWGVNNGGPQQSSNHFGTSNGLPTSAGGAVPPPGFAMNRGGHQVPNSFSNLNTNSDGHQIESKILPFTLS